jgi:hypothetical protein
MRAALTLNHKRLLPTIGVEIDATHCASIRRQLANHSTRLSPPATLPLPSETDSHSPTPPE